MVPIQHFNHTHTCKKNRDPSICLVVNASLDLFSQGINVKYTLSTCELCKSIALFVNVKTGVYTAAALCSRLSCIVHV